MRDDLCEPADPFLDAFAAALAGDIDALAAWWPDPDRGEAALSVYRNTVAKGCADALVSLFPAVERVVGADWLREAAVLYAAAQPPRRPAMIEYGETFADWLASFPPAADMPYLPGLARLDRLWTEAHLAADADPLDAAAFAALTGEDFGRLGATLHPSLRLAAFEDGLPGLWRALREPQDPPADLELTPEPQAIAILRPHGEVRSLLLGAGASAFLQGCANGQSLANAAGAALAAQPDLELAPVFAELIGAGAFTQVQSLSPPDHLQ